MSETGPHPGVQQLAQAKAGEAAKGQAETIGHISYEGFEGATGVSEGSFATAVVTAREYVPRR